MLFTAILALATIPNPCKYPFLDWCESYIRIREETCPLLRTRRFYIDTANNGTGDGLTAANAKGCATPAVLNTFISSTLLTGDVTYTIRKGASIKATDAAQTFNAQFGVNYAVLATYVKDSGDYAKAMPEVTAFKAAYGASGWETSTDRSDGFTNVKSRGEFPAFVRGADIADNLVAYIKQPYTRCSSIEDVDVTPFSFFVDDKLYVNPGTHPIATIQGVHGNGYGLRVSAHGCRVQGLAITGWGMQSDVSQQFNLFFEGSGGSVFYCQGCWFFWGPTHLAGQIVGSPGSPGGVSCWVGCRFGLALPDDQGKSAALIGYNIDGSQELFSSRCSYIGGLRDLDLHGDQVGIGQPAYGHTGQEDGPDHYTGLFVSHMAFYEDHPTNAVGSMCGCGSLPPIDDHKDWESCRSFRVFARCGGVITATGDSCLGIRSYDVCSKVRIKCPDGAIQNQLSTDDQTGCNINCDIDYDLRTANSVFPNNYVGWFNQFASAHKAAGDMIHTRFRARLGNGLQFMLDYENQSDDLKIWNSEMLAECEGTAEARVAIPNQDCRDHDGGQCGNAYFGFKYASDGDGQGWSGAAGAVLLDGSSPMDSLNPQCSRAGTAINDSQLVPEFDIDGRPRASGTPTIGPYIMPDTASLTSSGGGGGSSMNTSRVGYG